MAIPPWIQSNHKTLDAILAPAENAPHIFRQLFQLIFKPKPAEIFDRETKRINLRYPSHQSLPLLDLISKISIVYRSKGPWETSRQLQRMDWRPLKLASWPTEEEIQEFSSKISKLCDGALTSYQLTPCRIFYMKIFAYLERCSKRIESELLDLVKDDLVIFFYFMEGLETDDLTQLPVQSNRIGTCIASVQTIRQLLARQTYAKERVADCDKVLAILELLKTASLHPVALIPLLRRPIHNGNSQDILGVDSLLMDIPKVLVFVREFYYGFQALNAFFIHFVKSVLTKQNLKDFETFIQQQRQEQLQTADLVFKQLEGLLKSGDGVLGFENKLIEINNNFIEFSNKIDAFLKKVGAQLPILKHPFKPIEVRGTYLSMFYTGCVHHPQSHLFSLLFDVSNTQHNSAIWIKLTGEKIKALLPPPFDLMNSRYVTCVDLLEFHVRQYHYLESNKPEQKAFECLLRLFLEIRRSRTLKKGVSLDQAVKLWKELPDSQYKSILTVIVDTLSVEGGLPLFWESCAQGLQKTPELEEKFFKEALHVLSHALLTINLEEFRRPFDIAFRMKVNEGENLAVVQMKRSFKKIVTRLEKWRAKKDRDFFEEMQKFVTLIEEESERVELVLPQKPFSFGFEAMLKQFQKLEESFDLLFISFSQMFVRKKIEEELLAEPPEVEKREVPTFVQQPQPLEPIQEPIAIQQLPEREQPPIPKTLEEHWMAFQKICQMCEQNCRNFQSVSQKPFLAIQKETAATLLHLLEDFRELIGSIETHGHKPFFTVHLYLRVATALEQAARHVAAAMNIAILDEHAPLAFVQKLPKKLDVDEAFLGTLSRVIAISSRYPASGYDPLNKAIKQAFSENKAELLKKHAEQLLLNGMKNVLILLREVTAEGSPSPSSEVFEQEFAPVAMTGAVSKINLEVAEKIVSQIQLFRFSQENRTVSPLHPWEQTVSKREATIDASLRNLAMSLKICRDLLATVEEPSLCATLGTAMLLQRAVLLEQLQITFLAYLPIPGEKNREIHYLYEPSENRLKGHGHHLLEFAGHLSLLPQRWLTFIQENAKELEPFLKNLYRYYRPGMPIVDKLYALSRMRQRTISAEKLAELDSYIIAVLKSEVKVPLCEMIQAVDFGLYFLNHRMKKLKKI